MKALSSLQSHSTSLKMGLTSLVIILAVFFISCGNDDTVDNQPTETDFTDLLSNQVDEVIIPTVSEYQARLNALVLAADAFEAAKDQSSLDALRTAYAEAYLAYQAVAVHDYFAVASTGLVRRTNLYPVDVSVLGDLIANESYDFGTQAHERANGFPALDYMLYGTGDAVAYFNADAKRMAFLKELVLYMQKIADGIASNWSEQRSSFIENGGTGLGSSISVQLNQSLLYYEIHIRENKVGIPIGRIGPNDSPIPPDASKIEAYYQSQADANEDFTLALLKAAIEEMEDLYLGSTSTGSNGQAYDDLLIAREHVDVDQAIKAQFAAIYAQIESSSSISGDESLYESVQELVTLYKSDLLPILNVQDADGANDGD